MKKLIKQLLGEYWIYRLKEIKSKLLHAPEQIITEEHSIYQDFINPGDLCFDVGANIGNKIDILLKAGAKIVAIEPQDSCYRILKHKYGRKITLIKKGLGESESIKEFHISNSSTISSFSKEWIDSVKKSRFKNYNWDKVIKVPMTTLDNLIREFGNPVFIKIDVEGYELEVLKGLTQPVKMLSFEYTVPERTERIFECLDQIEKYNKNGKCNYSIGENMELILSEWLTLTELKEHIRTDKFPVSDFGDIYIRSMPDLK
ncbi:MAG TPA: FkbM family methyltransferase [Saprospiraceae bacterium]|nr:FkbM family methyltransferase [Saprospiraceae bacterium]